MDIWVTRNFLKIKSNEQMLTQLDQWRILSPGRFKRKTNKLYTIPALKRQTKYIYSTTQENCNFVAKFSTHLSRTVFILLYIFQRYLCILQNQIIVDFLF